MMVYDVVVIGGGVAGLVAASEARNNGATVLLLESDRLGGTFATLIDQDYFYDGKLLTGPELVETLIQEAEDDMVEIKTGVFVKDIAKKKTFEISYVSPEGIGVIKASAVVLATGARELNADDVFLQGDRPAGIFTTDEINYYINALGKLPTKKCIVYGSTDLGLKTARLLTLEGVEVEGVYEPNYFPNGKNKNLALCLNDFNIPLYLSYNVMGVYGKGRVKNVSLARSEQGNFIESSSKNVDCDAIILAMGKKPNDNLARRLGAKGDKYLYVDQNMSTTVDGLYVCGYAQNDYDQVEHLIESAEIAGLSASAYHVDARYAYADVSSKGIEKVSPSRINLNSDHFSVTCFFKTQKPLEKVQLSVKRGNEVIYTQIYPEIYPFELQRLCLDFSETRDKEVISFELE